MKGHGERRLVDGLDYHERIARLEKAVFGDKHTESLDQLRWQVQATTADVRRAAMPWWYRWLVRRKL